MGKPQENQGNEGQPASVPPPVRRYQLGIMIEADSEQIARDALERAMSRFKSGAPDWVETEGSHTGELSTCHNPQAPTGPAFRRALDDWSKKHGPARGSKPIV